MDLENASKEELENNDFICYSCTDSETFKQHRAMNLEEILTDSEDEDSNHNGSNNSKELENPVINGTLEATESVEDENDASTADDLRIVSIESAQKVDEDKIQEPDEGSDNGPQRKSSMQDQENIRGILDSDSEDDD